MFKRSYVAIVLVVAMLASLFPRHAFAAADATLTGGVESVIVSNIPSDATDVRLYTSNGTLLQTYQTDNPGAESTHTFTNVSPGIGYYVWSLRYDLPGRTTLQFAYDGSNQVSVDPHAVTANGGYGQVIVSNATSGALLELYQSGTAGVIDDYQLASGETGYTFESVAYGQNYYVMQTVNGRTSQNSNFVTSSLQTPSVSGGVEQVAVTAASESALVTLYYEDGSISDSEQLGSGQTAYTFTGVAPGLNYYVKQEHGGVVSAGSATVTVKPPVITANGGVNAVHVGGAMAGADIQLYSSDGTPVETYSLSGGETSHSFTGVPPGLGYFAAQIVNNAESDGSNTVTVSPAALNILGGTGTVQVTGAANGSVLKLYPSGGGAPVETHSLAGILTSHTFSYVAPGLNYYVTQSVSGVESAGSNTVTVTPEAVTVTGGTRAVQVTGAYGGATLNLYRADGILQETYHLGISDTVHLFADVPAGFGYYVQQVVNGAGSSASNTVTVSPSGISIFGAEQSVTAVGATGGAVLKLYQGNGVVVLAEHTLGAQESSYTFASVTPGLNYYVTQTDSGVEGTGSNTVTVTPAAPQLHRGVLSVSVTQATYGAEVILHQSDGTAIDQTSWLQGQTSFTFANVSPGHNYYAVQTLNGATSRASGLVASLPPAVQAVAGTRSIAVSGIMPGASLSVYGSNSASIASVPSVTSATYQITGLEAGVSYTVTQTVNNAESLPSATVTVLSDSNGGTSHSNSTAKDETPVATREIIIRLDGEQQSSIAKGKLVQLSGRTTLQVELDNAALQKKLAEKAKWSTLNVDVSSESGPVSIYWSGALAQLLAEKNITLEIRTATAIYRLPASEIRLPDWLKAWNVPASTSIEQIGFTAHVFPASDRQAQRFDQAAASANAKVVGTPVDFQLQVQTGGQTRDIDSFTTRVERELKMPGAVKAGEITTGVVLDEATGELRHVPTFIYTRDGVTYARISSLTNSIYGVIKHPVAISDTLPSWAKPAIQTMVDRLIMGTEQISEKRISFSPLKKMSRAEFASALVRLAGIYKSTTSVSFSDVLNETPYKGDIALAAGYGIINGYPDGTFRPEEPIRRGEALVMLQRALAIADIDSRLKSGKTSELNGFSDFPSVPAWAAKAVEFAVATDLIQGNNNRLDLQRNITRAETAVLLHRVMVNSQLINP